jgi:hypothetical protein
MWRWRKGTEKDFVVVMPLFCWSRKGAEEEIGR